MKKVIASAAAVLATVTACQPHDNEPEKSTVVKAVPYMETGKSIKFPTPKTTVRRVERHTDRVALKPRKRLDTTPRKPSGITISSYAWCPGHAQSCIDAGKLTGYNGNYLAGHNYMGYQWLSRVATGTTVHITSGPLAGTYRVYGHISLNRQGGSFPNTSGADLVLQSCESNGTGFSLARRYE